MNEKSNVNALNRLTQIIQSAANADTQEGQVQQIVDSMCDLLKVDVCTLYQRLSDDSLGLVASHGLLQTHPVVIPEGRGLVGQVLSQQRLINIEEPDQHKQYYYIANSKEETFHSFCGVPLIHRGNVNGVLVVQRFRADILVADEEAVLTTIGTHLALLLSSFPLDNFSKGLKRVVYHGVSGAPGLSIGSAFFTQVVQLSEVQKLSIDNVDTELTRWEALQVSAKQEIIREREVVQKSLGDGLASVLDAYQMLLEDNTFDTRVRDEIAAGHHLPWALKQAVNFFSEQFKQMEDPYLSARHEDIEHLGNKLYQILLGATELDLPAGDEPFILVGSKMSVSDIANLVTKNLVGIVCFAGGALSHIAVLANALGIPAVMGVGKMPIKNDDTLIVDGESAEVICSPNEMTLIEYKSAVADREALQTRLQVDSQLPAMTKDKVRVMLLANSGLQADVMPGLKFGAEGIGLYRTEIPFMIRSSLPSEDEQVEIYRNLINQYKEKPVYIRTLDIGGDKPLPYLPVIEEENPALGWRGSRFTLDNLPILITQLRAIIKAAEGNDCVHLLLPMISSTEQLDQCLMLLNEVYEKLLEEGLDVCRPKVGVMVEVPSSIALLPLWKGKLDFLSIGTNDLSQYLLALDRNSPLVSKWYDRLHPSVLHELMRIIKSAKALKIPVSVCGEMASDPIAVVLLIGMGVTQLSMSAARIPLIKWIIREISQSEAKDLLLEALTQDNAAAIRTIGQNFIDLKYNLAQSQDIKKPLTS